MAIFSTISAISAGSKLLGFAGGNKKLIFGIITVIAIGAYIFYLRGQVDHWHDEYVNIEKDFAQLEERARNNRLTLESTIKEQNEAVKKLNIDLKNREVILKGHITELQFLRDKHKRELKAMLDAAVPETCEDSIDFLRKGAGELTW